MQTISFLLFRLQPPFCLESSETWKKLKKNHFFPFPPAPSPGYPQDPDPHENFCPDPDPDPQKKMRIRNPDCREKTQYLIKTLYVIQHTAYDSSELLSSYLNLSWWHSSHSSPDLCDSVLYNCTYKLQVSVQFQEPITLFYWLIKKNMPINRIVISFPFLGTLIWDSALHPYSFLESIHVISVISGLCEEIILPHTKDRSTQVHK